MRVSRTRDPKLFNYSLTGQVLEDVMDTKYLGVTLSNNLEWSKHIATMTNKANSKLLSCKFVKRRYSRYSSVSHVLDELGCTPLSQRRLDLSCFTRLLMVWHMCPSKASLSRRISVLEEKHTMKFRQIGHTTGQSFFFLKLLVHGTVLLSLKLRHWLYLDHILL